MSEEAKMRLAGKAATLMFILFFPGFFFWHFLSAWLNIPFTMGFWGQTVVLSILALIVFVRQSLTVMVRGGLLSALFIFLIAYCATWTIGGLALSNPADIPQGSVNQISELMLAWVALFFVGVFVNLRGSKLRIILWMSWFGMGFLSIYFIDMRYLIVNPYDLFDKYPVSYQGFTRSVMLVCMALTATMRTDFSRILFSIVSCALIFTFGARSELYGFIFAIGLFESLRCMNHSKQVVVLWLCGMALFILVAINFDALSVSRQFNIFNLSADTSWNQRESEAGIAVQQIVSHPFLGVFAGHYKAGGIGTYAHNILSSWVSFGLLGFLVYTSINVISFTQCLNGTLRKTPAMYWRFAFYLNASSLIMVVSAKPVFWPMVALAWGSTIHAKWISYLEPDRQIGDRDQVSGI